MVRASIVSELVHNLDVFLDVMRAIPEILKNVHLDEAESTQLSPVDTSRRCNRLEIAISSVEQIFSSSVSQNHTLLASLAAEIRRTCNIAAPVNCVPDEILSRIFTFVPARKDKCRLSSTLLVASICRHWRKVALQHGALWAYVDLRGTAGGSPYSSNDPIADLFLSRSQECDLSVVFTDRSLGPFTNFGGQVFPAAYRWRRLMLHSNSNDISASLISTTFLGAFTQDSHHRPKLRSLYLSSVKRLDPSDTLGAALSELATLSPLESLTFKGPRPPLNPKVYTGLQDLSINSVQLPTRHIEPILRACAQLRKLILWDVIYPTRSRSSIDIVSRDPIIFPFLEELSVEVVYPSLTSFIFNSVHAPTLHSLGIGYDHQEPYKDRSREADRTSAIAFMMRHTSIRYLRLSLGVHQLLPTIPSLVNLEVFGMGNKHKCFDFQYDISDFLPVRACPKLSELRIWAKECTYISSIKKFIEVRAAVPTVSPIRALFFDCESFDDSKYSWKEEEYRQWFSQQMDVKLWRFYRSPYNDL